MRASAACGVLLLAALAAGCGQKGPLYLPDAPDAAVLQTVPAPAPTSSPGAEPPAPDPAPAAAPPTSPGGQTGRRSSR